MHTVKGTIKNGVVTPEEPINGREGQEVLITLLDDVERHDYPTLDEVVAEIKALGPNPANVIKPTESLAELLANVPDATPIDSVAWNRQWAAIEAEIKERDLADDRAEGRL